MEYIEKMTKTLVKFILRCLITFHLQNGKQNHHENKLGEGTKY